MLPLDSNGPPSFLLAKAVYSCACSFPSSSWTHICTPLAPYLPPPGLILWAHREGEGGGSLRAEVLDDPRRTGAPAPALGAGLGQRL